MPKCFVCGEKAKIFAGDKWWCEHHYTLLKGRAEKIKNYAESKEEGISKVDLGLPKI